MFPIYFKTALRSLRNNPGFSMINIIGLSAGIAACMLIMLYVQYELGYDKYNVNANLIYRITSHVKLNGNEASYASSEKPLKEALQVLPEIEKTARLVPVSSLFLSPKKFFVKKDDEVIEENKIVYTGPELFDIFTLPMIEGTANSLSEPFTAVITESTARKYFNRTNVIGQAITINDTSLYTITGVIKDVPSQSHFNYDFFLSFSSLPESQVNGWGYSGIHNYVLLKPGTNIPKLEAAIRDIELKHYPASITADGNYLTVVLMPLLNIHLRSTSLYELDKGGDIMYVTIFSVIAFFILLVACINFINLSTARSANRAKEVGVRKVIGSSRWSLIGQFLTESILVAFASTILAMLMARLMLPFFNQLAGRQLQITTNTLLSAVPVLLLITLVVGCLAGIYPALYLSAFKPILVLKGRLAGGFKRSYLRNFLVVFQFSVSIFLIIGTLVVYNQLSYMQNRDTGFNKSQMLVIKNASRLGNSVENFKQELKELPGVQNVTISGFLPTGKERNITGLFPQLPIDIKQDVLTEFWPVDEDYLKTMGMQLVNGRNFSRQLASDSMAIVVNEAFIKKMGFNEPLNKTVYRSSFGVQAYHIVGVVKDFNYSSLRNDVKPLALVNEHNKGAVTLQINSTNLPVLMAQVKDKWEQFSNHSAQFTYSFMDDDFDATYRTEEQMKQLFISFSLLSILIACLGLFGLSAYAAEQRNKEIAVRKVIGASTSKIINMFSGDFVKLVAISIIIGSPIGWYAMNKWLQDFAYRIHMSFTIFLLAGLIVLLIAMITVSFQAIRAAKANPVKSLRAE
ncbi:MULTISPECIES: ABC transporter permease [Niastella]|uniref:ABC transporter permease n=1 Tax=Niastella soli TaxID=2821487 RepID=A0ABS3Z548_9BACT|nr:ABC transporter permease [Niastella soli]MBO9205277.1 ABC transporter permease [Niastella soli]